MLHIDTNLVLNECMMNRWLRQIWSCESEKDEMSESTAIRLAKKFNPFASEKEAKRVVVVCYLYSIMSTSATIQCVISQ